MTLEGFAAAKALVAVIRQSKRGGRLALEEFAARNGTIDLGGNVGHRYQGQQPAVWLCRHCAVPQGKRAGVLALDAHVDPDLFPPAAFLLDPVSERRMLVEPIPLELDVNAILHLQAHPADIIIDARMQEDDCQPQ